MLRKLLFLLFSLVTIMAMGQTAQTKKQSLPEQPGFELQDGTVYTVDKTMTLDGNSTGGFINGLKVADGATVTLYIPAGVTLTVIGQNADGQHRAGAGIYVPASSTLYITGKGTLIAQGGKGGNGGDGTSGGNATAKGNKTVSGYGGNGGYGGGGAAAAIGGNGGDGGGTTTGAISLSAQRNSEGQNGLPALPTSTDYNGKDGSAGTTMGNVYILGEVIVKTTNGSAGTSAGNAGQHGSYQNKTNKGFWAGGGGAGAGGGAGLAASYGIGGGAGGAGGGAAGGSGAADTDSNASNYNTVTANATGHGGSATGYGEGAINGKVCDDTNTPRDNGGLEYRNQEVLKRFGGYGGTVGGKAGTQGGDGTVYIEPSSEANLDQATIGNLVTLADDNVQSALNPLRVNIKLNNQNDTPAGSVTAYFGEKLPDLSIPEKNTRGGYEFMGYYTQPNGQGEQIYHVVDGVVTPTPEGRRCEYVQDDSPVLYAHWVLMQYTINWSYEYYDGSRQQNVIVEDAKRCKSATVTLRLNDGTKNFTMAVNPEESETFVTKTVVLRDLIGQGVITDDDFRKIVSVQDVTPIKPAGSESDVVQINLNYMTESEATIFYDPTRYMVKWSINVDADTKPEYLLVNVKRGLTDATSDASMEGEEESRYYQLRIRKNANGTYDGSAILRYQDDNDKKYYYSLEVIGARDDSGHDILFASPIVSLGKTNGVVSCDKPVSGPTTPNPENGISLSIALKTLTLDANGGHLSDDTPEKMWDVENATVTIPAGYTASRANYTYFGWGATAGADENSLITQVNIGSGNTIYAVLLDKTPPQITIGEYAPNTESSEKYYVPVTVTDAISEDNILYYAFYDTNENTPAIDSEVWETLVSQGKATKKVLPHGHSATEKAKFDTESVIYLHVKAVDASGNSAVASKEIKVDTKAPVIEAYPNVDNFCATDVVVDVTDNVGVKNLTISPNVTTTDIEGGKTMTLQKPGDENGINVYVISATDAAGNETVRNITIYAKHNFEEGTMIQAIEPTASSEGYYRYKKCAQCSHIILLRGNTETQIDITDEAQRGAWIIPAGAVMVMEPWNGGLDIVDHGTYVNDALTKTNTVTSATQVRLSKDTQLANNSATTSIVTPNRNIDLELNGHGLMTGNNSTGIIGNDNVTILLSDGNNRGKANGHTQEYATDIIPYKNQSPVTGSPIKYTRKFSGIQQGNWQALYLPFAFTYDSSDFELAQLNTDESTDFEKEGDGHVVLKVKKVEANSTATVDARTPLFISSNTDKLELVVRGQTLPAATSHTANHSGMFIGTLYDSPESVASNPFWVMLNNGNLWYAKAGQTQRPYRWVIQPTSGSGVKSISFQLIDDADDIKEVNQKRNDDGNIYTIDGRKVPSASSLQPGIYIVNGKKMVIK